MNNNNVITSIDMLKFVKLINIVELHNSLH